MAGAPGIYEYWDSGDMKMTKEVKKKRALTGHVSEEVCPETDQAAQFEEVMAGAQGFHCTGIGPSMWDEANTKGKGKGNNMPSASSSAHGPQHTDTVTTQAKAKEPMTDEKKKAK
eukprot:6241025-Lingulodinium_polyedra.AAC.1